MSGGAGSCAWGERGLGLTPTASTRTPAGRRTEGALLAAACPAYQHWQPTFSHSNFTLFQAELHLRKIGVFCFGFFFLNIRRLECICCIVKPKNMDNAWLIYLIGLMASSTWGVVSETTRESNTSRWVHVSGWDSALFLTSCLPLLVGWSKRKLAEITPCHFSAELKTSKHYLHNSDCRNNKLIIPKKKIIWSFDSHTVY